MPAVGMTVAQGRSLAMIERLSQHAGRNIGVINITKNWSGWRDSNSRPLPPEDLAHLFKTYQSTIYRNISEISIVVV
jgi:hypothetical protein